jgi:hypothetical protein
MPIPLVIGAVGLAISAIAVAAEAADREAQKVEARRLKGTDLHLFNIVTSIPVGEWMPREEREAIRGQLRSFGAGDGGVDFLWNAREQAQLSGAAAQYGLSVALIASKLNLRGQDGAFQDAFFAATFRWLDGAAVLGDPRAVVAALLGDVEKAVGALAADSPGAPPSDLSYFAGKHGLRDDALSFAVSGLHASAVPAPEAFDPLTGDRLGLHSGLDARFYSTNVLRSFTQDALPYAGRATGSASQFLSFASGTPVSVPPLERDELVAPVDGASANDDDQAGKVALVAAAGAAAAAYVWFFVGKR